MSLREQVQYAWVIAWAATQPCVSPSFFVRAHRCRGKKRCPTCAARWLVAEAKKGAPKPKRTTRRLRRISLSKRRRRLT